MEFRNFCKNKDLVGKWLVYYLLSVIQPVSKVVPLNIYPERGGRGFKILRNTDATRGE